MHDCPECGMPCDCDGTWQECDHCLEKEDIDTPDDGWWITFGGEEDD